MLIDTIQKIQKKEELRSNIISLKLMLKEDKTKNTHNRNDLLLYLNGDFGIFYGLLNHEDAKVRKNVAIIMGEIAESKFLPYLFSAYQKETQMFVKSSYLTAIRSLDYQSIIPDLRECLTKLSKETITDENKKHISEEMHVLTEMLQIGNRHKHTFCGYFENSELALLTNRNHIHVTYDELAGISRKKFNAGVMVKTNQLNKVMEVRTYREMLFVVEGMKTVPGDFVSAAEIIAKSKLLEFLEKRHKEDATFYFRIELKSKMDLEKRSKFTKRLSMELEHLTERKLMNSTGNYEIELRLIETKDGRYNVLLKLFTLPDERFSYRKHTIPVSLHPVNAALVMQLAKNYFIENAQVLDPFCGVGTMLIERNKIMKTKTMYGIDIYGDAIRYARENSEEAGLIINYINRDFFNFKHEYLFDELITDMPFLPERREDKELTLLYKSFFIKVKEHMKPQGIMVLYTHNHDLVKKYCKSVNYKIEKEFEISMKEGTYVVIIRVI